MLRFSWKSLLFLFAGLTVFGYLIYLYPPINQRLAWRMDFALTYLHSLVKPARLMPTALPPPDITTNPLPGVTPLASTTPSPTAMSLKLEALPSSPTPTALSPYVLLPAPTWVKQDINNCGPASLAMYLQYYGWEGNQRDISDLIKPIPQDRNVNVEELVYYVRTKEGWLNAEFRVGGNISLLKQILAFGMPVMVEEGFLMNESFWFNDDRWAGHYLLLTGYDDANQTFTAQDSYYGADQTVPYQKLDRNWQAFNRVYILIFPPDQTESVQQLIGDNWEVDANRAQALELAQLETQADPQNAFAWFNLGSNLVYFERYGEAARAYDNARQLGLPQRMLRYQFGPFFAYFHSGRNGELLALADYALDRTPNSEETLLWRGWGLFREGKIAEAKASFLKALEANPNYQDALYALDFLATYP